MITRLKKHIKAGRFYNRSDLKPYSSSIDRDLSALVDSGFLKRISTGLYIKSETKISEDQLIRKVLGGRGENRSFLILPKNIFFEIEDDKKIILNKKRTNSITVEGIKYNFVIPFNRFPAKYSDEFLFIYALNIQKSEKSLIFNKFFKHFPKDRWMVLKEAASKFGNKNTYQYIKAEIEYRIEYEKITKNLARIGAPIFITHDMVTSQDEIDINDITEKALIWGKKEPRIHNVIPYVIYLNKEEIDFEILIKRAKENKTYNYLGYILNLLEILGLKISLNQRLTKPRIKKPKPLFSDLYSSTRAMKRLSRDGLNIAREWGMLVDDTIAGQKEKFSKWGKIKKGASFFTIV